MGLQNGIFATQILWKILITPLHATWHAHLMLFDLITLIIVGKEFKLRSSLLWSVLYPVQCFVLKHTQVCSYHDFTHLYSCIMYYRLFITKLWFFFSFSTQLCQENEGSKTSGRTSSVSEIWNLFTIWMKSEFIFSHSLFFSARWEGVISDIMVCCSNRKN